MRGRRVEEMSRNECEWKEKRAEKEAEKRRATVAACLAGCCRQARCMARRRRGHLLMMARRWQGPFKQSGQPRKNSPASPGGNSSHRKIQWGCAFRHVCARVAPNADANKVCWQWQGGGGLAHSVGLAWFAKPPLLRITRATWSELSPSDSEIPLLPAAEVAAGVQHVMQSLVRERARMTRGLGEPREERGAEERGAEEASTHARRRSRWPEPAPGGCPCPSWTC